jgi:hypothetical protein
VPFGSDWLALSVWGTPVRYAATEQTSVAAYRCSSLRGRGHLFAWRMVARRPNVQRARRNVDSPQAGPKHPVRNNRQTSTAPSVVCSQCCRRAWSILPKRTQDFALARGRAGHQPATPGFVDIPGMRRINAGRASVGGSRGVELAWHCRPADRIEVQTTGFRDQGSRTGMLLPTRTRSRGGRQSWRAVCPSQTLWVLSALPVLRVPRTGRPRVFRSSWC